MIPVFTVSVVAHVVHIIFSVYLYNGRIMYAISVPVAVASAVESNTAVFHFSERILTYGISNLRMSYPSVKAELLFPKGEIKIVESVVSLRHSSAPDVVTGHLKYSIGLELSDSF